MANKNCVFGIIGFIIVYIVSVMAGAFIGFLGPVFWVFFSGIISIACFIFLFLFSFKMAEIWLGYRTVYFGFSYPFGCQRNKLARRSDYNSCRCAFWHSALYYWKYLSESCLCVISYSFIGTYKLEHAIMDKYTMVCFKCDRRDGAVLCRRIGVSCQFKNIDIGYRGCFIFCLFGNKIVSLSYEKIRRKIYLILIYYNLSGSSIIFFEGPVF